jgi:hypothetical protein
MSDEILNNFKTIATELTNEFVFSSAVVAAHKPGGILKTALEIIKTYVQKNQALSAGYRQIFNFLDFDTFAQIKELYSSQTYDIIPSWDQYFTVHGIKRHAIKSSGDPIRLIFTRIKSAKSARDGQIRAPYWISLYDIDYAGYYKLLKFLILSYYNINDRINASRFSIAGQKAALETNAAYIMINGHRVKNLQQCIDEINQENLTYLVEKLGLKPTWGQLNQIEKKFSYNIYELIAYYFE